ncbi:MAG TPA: glycosyltransferase family 2 protein [Vicinamibacterales bacterium]|nr:glycosyltransferase family 2 protein [Vicinamibacterales bacterium]
MKLTVTVITRDEAANIEAALRSVAWADEIIVVDSRSTDETVEIARRFATRVDIREWPGYSEQKNYAASLATHDWILSIDADERVTPALAAEIQALLGRGPAARGYRISRVTWYLGRWLHGTDWYPDYQLRLYDRRAGRWNRRRVHESFELEGSAGRLEHHLEHYAYRDVSDHISSIDHYTTLAAEQWAEEGRRTTILELVLHPPVAFLRNYVLRRGFTNGAAGFLVSTLNSYYVFLKLVKLWELQHGWRRPGELPGAAVAAGARTEAHDRREPDGGLSGADGRP